MSALNRTLKITGRVLLGALVVIVVALVCIALVPGYGMFFVRSESMKPVINLGDLVITTPPGSLLGKLSIGRIVTYEKNGTRVTHRIIDIKNGDYITKGDASEDPDALPVRPDEIKGVVLFKVPGIGYLVSFIRTKTGWFVSILIPAAILIGLIVKDIIKEAFREDKPEGDKKGVGAGAAKNSP